MKIFTLDNMFTCDCGKKAPSSPHLSGLWDVELTYVCSECGEGYHLLSGFARKIGEDPDQ